MINNPEAYLVSFVDSIREMMIEDFAHMAFEEGANFAIEVGELNRDIKIQKSKDPKLND